MTPDGAAARTRPSRSPTPPASTSCWSTSTAPPQGGARARLAAARMLLPVLGLPGARRRPGARGGDPTPLTVLYPIADTPHRLSTVPGRAAAARRRHPRRLVRAHRAARRARRGARAARARGLAGAVRALPGHRSRPRRDRVGDEPGLPGRRPQRGHDARAPAPPSPASGSPSCAAVAKGGCVIALPYADADLVALTRGGLTDAATRALGPGRQILSTLLQTPVPADIAWPADGIDRQRHARRRAGRRRAVGAAVRGRRHGQGPRRGRAARRPAGQRAAHRPAAHARRDAHRRRSRPRQARGPRPPPSPSRATTARWPRRTSSARSAYRATAGTPLVLAPPHQWRTDGAGARALLDAVGALVTAGEVNPVGLADAVAAAAPPAGPACVPTRP